MVRVWIMLVRVRHRLVMMNMCMSRARCNGIRVIVLVMFIVGVFMLVIHGGVWVRMNMLFGQMKPQPESHESPGCHELDAQPFMQQEDRENCPEKWRDGEISPSSCRPEIAQAHDEEH